MPSDTFLRLNDEKKRKLIDASFKEFSLNNFNDASINRIIKEAGISRGSFYMYFIDKKDLYFYLLEQYGEILVNNMKRDLIKNKGDLFKMFQDNIKESYNSFKNDNINFFKKSLENITIMEESKRTFGFRDKRLLKELIPNINLELLNDNAKRHIEVIFAINMHLLMVTLMKLLKNDSLDEEILKDYYEQLDLLKYGCNKKEEVC
ncbi:MAG TPA: TetR/AcrR family transcriptional regulator [Candidatus Onthousia faecipullorum]|uniref:TetR/AcrR family transcriptional regulator n=1 Tax=Candidatus Onthousia faecipullorum TaxID=2840887 RepID=A0A9D1GCT0_9FIRM|nr:TetR/AcrR family transcriptional regulator [Candidatus Onthousia faecipullorum]